MESLEVLLEAFLVRSLDKYLLKSLEGYLKVLEDYLRGPLDELTV